MFIRQAFAHVETKQKKKFGVVISALLALILARACWPITSIGSFCNKEPRRRNSSMPSRRRTSILPISIGPLASQTARQASKSSTNFAPDERKWRKTTTNISRRCTSIAQR